MPSNGGYAAKGFGHDPYAEMALPPGRAGMTFVEVAFVLDRELGGGKTALEPFAQALRATERGRRRDLGGLAAQPENLRYQKNHRGNAYAENFEIYPDTLGEIAGHINIGNRQQRKPYDPDGVDEQPGARGDLQGFLKDGLEHAAHQRLLADDHAAEERDRRQRQQHSRLQLNKTLVVQQQGCSAQNHHDRGGNDVHGFEFAGAQSIHDQQQHASGHQCRSGPVDIQDLERNEKYDEGRPLEELTHAGIIADAMSIYLQLHPVSPQRRYVRQAVEALRRGAVIVYPTDSCYALGCHIGDKAALERIREIRQTDRNHHFTLVCRDLADVGKYAMVDNWQYRLLRAHTPGPYTFLLKASRETPRRLKHERRGTIGLRVPDHPVTAMLLSELGEPVMSSTLLLPGEDLPRTDAKDIYDKLEHSVDLVLDGGNCGLIPTSVIDLSGDHAVVARVGRGDVSPFAATVTV
jgi:tRNA threonylcarbamoyl adenosine modification protein (Sua5/YciO/YrdC/YwlC family)